MKVSLIYPPAGDPRAPQLALPSLAAFLRAIGHQVDLLDFNLASIEDLLAPERLAETHLSLRTRQREDVRLLALSEHVLDTAPGALAALRSPRGFYDPHELNASRDTIEAALHVACAARAPTVSFGLRPIRYDIQGLDPSSLRQLLQGTADPRFNVFHTSWHDRLIPALERSAPDVVGITITNRQQIFPGLMLARALRMKGLRVVLGGAYYSKFADSLPAHPEFFRVFADGIVVYEGETALAELLEQLRGACDFNRVPNFRWMDSQGRTFATLNHLEDVSRLPTPDFEGLSLRGYLVPEPVLPILMGKGCYYNRCRFCDIPYINHISRKPYRIRAPEQVVQDVCCLEERFGARSFVMTDEALSPALLLKLADAFDQVPADDRAFSGYARLEDGFSDAVFTRMRSIGFRKIFFGMESASQATLDHMDKGTRAKSAAGILRSCLAADIHVHLFAIIGSPEETVERARETYRFFIDHQELLDRPGNSFDLHPFGLHLRTSYFEERDRFGVIVPPESLRREFLNRPGRGEWLNSRGMSTDEVDQLIRGEFLPGLRRAFQFYRQDEPPVWPSTEEYSILYHRRFAGRPFRYLNRLPDDGVGFHTRWNPACAVSVAGEECRMDLHDRSIRIARAVYELCRSPETRTMTSFLAAWGLSASEEPEVIEKLLALLNRLIGLGMLQLLPVTRDCGPDARHAVQGML